MAKYYETALAANAARSIEIALSLGCDQLAVVIATGDFLDPDFIKEFAVWELRLLGAQDIANTRQANLANQIGRTVNGKPAKYKPASRFIARLFDNSEGSELGML